MVPEPLTGVHLMSARAEPELVAYPEQYAGATKPSDLRLTIPRMS